MKRLIISHLALLLLLVVEPALAQTSSYIVLNQQESVQVITNLNLTTTRTTAWFYTKQQAAVALDWEITRGGTVSAITMTCETCRVVTSGTCQDTYTKSVPVIVSTDSAGLSTLKNSSWYWPNIAGNVASTFIVRNMYAPYTRCSFAATAGAAGDALNVWRRLISGP